MLVVDSIVPGSHAEQLLEPGDVVTRVEGRVVTHFLTLEDILDSAVGKSVALDVERGGQPVHVTVQVQPVGILTMKLCHEIQRVEATWQRGSAVMIDAALSRKLCG